MKHDIIEFNNVQIIGMAKTIPFKKGAEECPIFWGEYYERIVKPIYIEGKQPDAFQSAAIENNIGELALCSCSLPNHNCATCAQEHFAGGNKNCFTYVIGGIYKGGTIPSGLHVYPIRDGRWLKIHFEGGLKTFHQQVDYFFSHWLIQHPEFQLAKNSSTLEWYFGTDINAPDYQCGIIIPIE